MSRCLLFFLFVICFLCNGQVKPEYLYNTSLPFGTLDLRTKISATEYYYLQENITFSFRESSPGVRTNTFAKVTNWDSSPYGEGNMRKKTGANDEFIMNYRLLKPLNYDANFPDGYPLIVIMHGAVERGNCYYNDCYHADWNYNPNTNDPPAPTNPDNRLLNNDYHLTQSAKEHLAARNLAGTKLPNDPTLSARAFPGFVLMPQMLNVWDSLTVEDMIRVVLLHVEKYKINPDRVYIHGLSIGGYATYEAIKRAPWLFAAALPMSAVTEAGNIFKHNQQDKVAHIPLWTFQGGLDDDPSPSFTQATVDKFKASGASIKLTVYPDLGHRVWGRAYQEPNFFSWILSKRKNQIHALHGITQIDNDKKTYPKLVLAEGFYAYQWEQNGTLIPGATSNRFSPTSAGTYRARFSRKASPGVADWNTWSDPISITSIGGASTPPPTDPPAEEEPEEPTEETPPAEEEPTPPEETPTEETPDEEPAPETPATPPSQPPATPPAQPPSNPPPAPPPANPPPAGNNGGATPPPAGNNGGSTPPPPAPGTQDPDLSGKDGDDIEDEDEVTGVEDHPTVSISVYPNPTNSAAIEVEVIGMKDVYTMTIVDLLGGVKYARQFSSGTQRILLENLNLQRGIYNVVISSGSLRFTKRLLVR
jgi:hypothetical protein